MTIRSVLWFGSATGLAASGLPEAPRFDVVWERDLERLALLPLDPFDAVVITDFQNAQATFDTIREFVDTELILAPDLLRISRKPPKFVK